jgi:hypothetical protein
MWLCSLPIRSTRLTHIRAGGEAQAVENLLSKCKSEFKPQYPKTKTKQNDLPLLLRAVLENHYHCSITSHLIHAT